MAKTRNNSIPILEDFKKWATTVGGIKPEVADNYCTWLKNIPNDIELVQPLCDYLRIIGSFVFHGDRYFALGFIEKVCESLNCYKRNRDSSKTLSNDQSALYKYREFLFNGVNYSTFAKCTGEVYKPESKELTIARRIIKKGDNVSIDSMRSLLAVLGENQFIKMAIENSFFFSKDIVCSRFANMQTEDSLPVRWGNEDNLKVCEEKVDDSTIMDYCKKGYCHKVIVDGGPKKRGKNKFRKRDENNHVRKLIKDYTGYTLTGNNPIFQNYIISHVWGNATDPRYYTNFWNIVLVPAWANFLLDKNQKNKSEDVDESSIKGGTSSKLKATFMAICTKLYDMYNMDWESLKMGKPMISNEDDIQVDKYHIQIINSIIKEKDIGLKLGHISIKDDMEIKKN